MPDDRMSDAELVAVVAATNALCRQFDVMAICGLGPVTSAAAKRHAVGFVLPTMRALEEFAAPANFLWPTP